MTRKELLEAAIKTVTEDRQDQYGSPERSLEAIACFGPRTFAPPIPALTSSSAVATWLL